MRIAIMQPYFFPYIGYFQLVNAVDVFVFYDDVNFIKKGWINRNRILVLNNEFLFTVPLHKQNSFISIKNKLINKALYENWKSNFTQTLTRNYKKAPFFRETYDLIRQVLGKDCDSISELAVQSVQLVSEYLGITTQFKISSEAYQNQTLQKQERLIDICKQEKATEYFNLIGGKELYDKGDFRKEDIVLHFIQSLPIEYKQFKNPFVPWLSVIDVMMFNDKESISEFLTKYKIF